MWNTRNQRWALLLLVGTLLVFSASSTFAQSADPLRLQVEAAVLIDADTGKVLYQKNADQPLAMASMSKILTEYLILEAINNQQISWEDTTSISGMHTAFPRISPFNVPLRRDEHYTIRELYEAMAIYSANGAAIALAEVLAVAKPSLCV